MGEDLTPVTATVDLSQLLRSEGSWRKRTEECFTEGRAILTTMFGWEVKVVPVRKLNEENVG